VRLTPEPTLSADGPPQSDLLKNCPGLAETADEPTFRLRWFNNRATCPLSMGMVSLRGRDHRTRANRLIVETQLGSAALHCLCVGE